jgi:hypothetical protein
MSKLLAVAAVLLASTLPSVSMAADVSQSEAAKALLQKTVAAVAADRADALSKIASGAEGFTDGDLYPACFSVADGTIYPFANPNGQASVGQDMRSIKDVTGKLYGQELFDGAQKPEGEVTEVRYVFPKPGDDATPVAKVAFVTHVADLGCLVGYYE